MAMIQQASFMIPESPSLPTSLLRVYSIHRVQESTLRVNWSPAGSPSSPQEEPLVVKTASAGFFLMLTVYISKLKNIFIPVWPSTPGGFLQKVVFDGRNSPNPNSVALEQTPGPTQEGLEACGAQESTLAIIIRAEQSQFSPFMGRKRGWPGKQSQLTQGSRGRGGALTAVWRGSILESKRACVCAATGGVRRWPWP